MKKPLKKIPWEALAKAKSEAQTPSKKLGPLTVTINEAVIDLKAARQTGESSFSTEKAWYELADALNNAVKNLDFTAFDEFAKAWSNIEVDAFLWKSNGAKIVCGRPKNKPRQPVTAAIVFAVELLQDLLDRPPTRQEIIKFMAENDAMNDKISIDDTECSRQLKKLGWQKWIPKVEELAS